METSWQQVVSAYNDWVHGRQSASVPQALHILDLFPSCCMANLTPAEKQDVIRFLDADKPLPDKYRFLLFEDKREVELVWNGKTNEVCNVALPFQVIEQVDEPRAEKPEETKFQLELFDFDTRGRQIKGWTNQLICGDNKLIL